MILNSHLALTKYRRPLFHQFMESLFSLALTFFLVTNPIGNSPTILSLVKGFDFKRQKQIMLREGLFALLIAVFFQYLGEPFLTLLNVKTYAITACGGILLFLISLHMIFALMESPEHSALKQEPFIVPIAIPLLSGAGLLTIIMLKSNLIQNSLYISSAILIAWIGILAILWTAPYLQRAIGRRGMLALEQLMGLLLMMMAVEMLVKGVHMFLDQTTFGGV